MLMRYLIAAMAGAVVAFGLIIALDALGHWLFPQYVIRPTMSREQMGIVIEHLPLAAKTWILCTWVAATVAGAAIAVRLGRDRSPLMAGIIGALVLAATSANLAMIPHPTWMTIAGPSLIVLAAWLIGRRSSQ
jgi:hypothetical protein